MFFGYMKPLQQQRLQPTPVCCPALITCLQQHPSSRMSLWFLIPRWPCLGNLEKVKEALLFSTILWIHQVSLCVTFRSPNVLTAGIPNTIEISVACILKRWQRLGNLTWAIAVSSLLDGGSSGKPIGTHLFPISLPQSDCPRLGKLRGTTANKLFQSSPPFKLKRNSLALKYYDWSVCLMVTFLEGEEK